MMSNGSKLTLTGELNMQWLNDVLNFFQSYAEIIFAIIGVFSLIATKTPNKADDKIVQTILDLVNFLGMNFGKAKNDSNV